MGKNKLKKFSEMEQMKNVYQYPFGRLREEGFPLRGKWGEDVFGNGRPITLELGCGKGEYTVGLARRFPERNFIGIDIKGARMWSGAKAAIAEGLGNAAFLRTSIELLEGFFAEGEIAEIWITFPDPQMKKANKRLTGSRFQTMYRRVLVRGGNLNLKTDSPFLYEYTRMIAAANDMKVTADFSDIYATEGAPAMLTEVQTHYEKQWLGRGLSIKYLSWRLPEGENALLEPENEPEPDSYRSYGRGILQQKQP